MARIPDAQGFGQVIAQPERPDRRRDVVTPDANGAGLARAVSGIAQDAIHVQRVEEEQAIRVRDAADRANATRAVHTGRETARAAHDEFVEAVKSGAIPKEEAAERWNTRLQEIRASSLTGVPSKYAKDAGADFDLVGQTLGRGVTKAVTARGQSEVRDGLNSTFEAASRLYMKDPASANAMVDAAVADLGPASGLTPEQLGKARQKWTEDTRFTKASDAIVGARRDNKALGKVEEMLASGEFADMDPQRKVTLAGQIEGFKVSNIQRAEAAAARARAEQDAALRKAEAAYNAASGLVTAGKTLSPEYISQLTAQTHGTPYAAALPDMLKQAPERSAFGMQPIGTMDAVINRARAELNVRGTDPATEKKVNQLEAIRDEKRKAMADDPLLGAMEYGGPPVDPIDTGSVQGLLASVGSRSGAVTFASQQMGGQPVSPLTKQEAEAVGKMFTVLPVEQRSTAIAQLAQAIGPQQAAALGRQMAPKDTALGISFALAGDRTSAGRYTSELVLKGDQAIKDKAVKKDSAAVSGVRARVAAEIGDAYPDQGVREAMIEGAVLAEYGLQAEGGGNPRNAVRLVTGGITERAGRKVPLPRGMEAPVFDQRLSSLTAENLRTGLPDGKVYVSGTSMATEDFLKQVPNAALIHAGQGRYAVQTGAGVATNAAGVPLILEVK